MREVATPFEDLELAVGNRGCVGLDLGVDVKEGAAIEDFVKPDRVVVGVRRPEVADVLRELVEGADAALASVRDLKVRP